MRMPDRYPIHKTHDPETSEPLKEYYTQNPISEGAEFGVQYGGQTLQFRIASHWLTSKTTSTVELIGVSGGVKRPRLPRS